MEHTYQYAWIIPFLPLPIPMLLGVGLLLFPTATKNLRRMWSFTSVLLLSIVMTFSVNLSIHQINSSSIYQYVWSWTINNDFSLDDNYMSHDQGYLRFISYMSFFNASMLGLVTIGMCSYLLIGFWFTRPIAANACQKAFVTNRVGDFGLLLGILGLYWITGSFEFRDLFEIFNNLIYNNGTNFLFVSLCALFLFVGAGLLLFRFIHAATMVAAGIFLVARLFPLFIVIPYIMNLISLIGIITILLGATLALAQKDIKKSLAYSTMSQLGYTMLALGMGSYRAALFHLITHAYSKALLFLGSGSIIHSMEAIVGYSPDKSQNMVLMGGLTKHVPITKNTFLLGTLSLCGIPPLACFWSKDEILNDSWLYSPIFAIIACLTAGLTAFYMFRIYLLTFEGYFNVHCKNYNGKKIACSIQYLYGVKKVKKQLKKNHLLTLLTTNNNENEKAFFFSKKVYRLDGNNTFLYSQELDNTMLFPLFALALFTLFVGAIGIPFNQERMDFDILSKWLNPATNLLHKNLNNYGDWYEFVKNAIFSVSISYFGIFLASLLYNPVYSSLQNLDLINSVAKKVPKRIFWDKIINKVYNWSYNRGYIDAFYETSLTKGIRGLAELTHFFDGRVIDGITNGVGVTSFFVGESIKYVGGGRISSYLFLYLSSVSILLLISYFFFNQKNKKIFKESKS
ncbi:hypothetical protein AAG906_019322 [Vitis piasezkii]